VPFEYGGICSSKSEEVHHLRRTMPPPLENLRIRLIVGSTSAAVALDGLSMIQTIRDLLASQIRESRYQYALDASKVAVASPRSPYCAWTVSPTGSREIIGSGVTRLIVSQRGLQVPAG